MTLTVQSVVDDLAAEHRALDAVVASLTEEQWQAPTPAEGWSVADEIAHLTYYDGTAAAAITDPEEFQRAFEELMESAGGGMDAVDDLTIGWSRKLPGSELLERWRAGRAKLLEAGAGLAEDARVPWYGPSMGSKSFLTARMMETWAHGQDIVDAVGASREPTDRLRHIAQLGYITRKWTYVNRGAEAPEGDVFVDLTSPSGESWTWGDPEAPDSVRGPAEDFCLVVCQRRHFSDTALTVNGGAAEDWMSKAQVFAGPATDGPEPGT